MKYRHLQIFIGILALLLIPINIYYNGHTIVTISMLLVALGMGIQSFTLYHQEKKSSPAYVKTTVNATNLIFLLFVLAIGGIGFFGAKNWSGPLIVSIILGIILGIVWFLRTNKKI